jgi:hypothetical protein
MIFATKSNFSHKNVNVLRLNFKKSYKVPMKSFVNLAKDLCKILWYWHKHKEGGCLLAIESITDLDKLISDPRFGFGFKQHCAININQ